MVRSFPLSESFLTGKSILITGGTGFVGKAILELILRDHYPHVKQVFCLVRARKGQSVQDRLINDVLTNKLFNVIRDKLGQKNFISKIESKLVGIEGDISLPELGMKPEDRLRLNKELNIVIHCAATVDFNERLDRSLILNTLGTMQILDLCEQCEFFKGFVHVSTAYVNSNRKETKVYERVYPMVFGEPKELIQRIQKMNLDEIELFTKEILQVYPNTYTFTKSLAENMVLDRAEQLRALEIKEGKPAFSLAIVRPSVVTSTAADPVPGWADGVSAANGISMYIGMGVIDSTPGPKHSVFDLVPVDFLANVVIRACAEFKPPGIRFTLSLADGSRSVTTLTSELPIDPTESIYPKIYHATSSSVNPITWLRYGTLIVKAWDKLPPLRKRVFDPSFETFMTEKEYLENKSIQEQYKFTTVAMLISLTDPKRGKKIGELRTKLDFLYFCFNHFMKNEWFFQNHQVEMMEHEQLDRKMTILSSRFNLDGLRRMPWENYLNMFAYGMYYFVLSESRSIRPPNFISAGWECVLHKREQLIERNLLDGDSSNDLISLHQPWKVESAHKLRSKFIHDPIVKGCIAKLADSGEDVSLPKIQQRLLNEIISLEPSLGSLGDQENISSLGDWLRQGVESIHVNKSKILKLKDLVRLHSSPKVIYLPTHHSHLDFGLLCHVLNLYDLPIPKIASEGQFKLVSYLPQPNNKLLLTRSPFTKLTNDWDIRRKMTGQYLLRLLECNGSAVMFLDEAPNNPSFNQLYDLKSELFSQLLNQLAFDEPQLGADVILVPISINYEQGLDQPHIATQWQTNRKDHGLANIHNLTHRGRIHVAFGNAMELPRFYQQIQMMQQLDINDLSLTHPRYMIKSWQLQSQLISPVALFSMVLMGFRHTSLPFSKARGLLTKMRNQVTKLGHSVDWQDGEDASAIVTYSLEVIGKEFVQMDDKNNISLVNDSERTTLRLQSLLTQAQHVLIFDGLLMLSYHHVLLSKPSVTDVLAAGMSESSPPTLGDIEARFNYLVKMLPRAYPELISMGPQFPFQKIVQRLHNQDIIQIIQLKLGSLVDESNVMVLNGDPITLDYLHCLMCCLHPILDGYWATTCSLTMLPHLKGNDKDQPEISLIKYVDLIQSGIRSSSNVHVKHCSEAAATPIIYSAIATLFDEGLISIDPKSTTIAHHPDSGGVSLVDQIVKWCPIDEQILNYEKSTNPFLNRVAIISHAIEQFRSLTIAKYYTATKQDGNWEASDLELNPPPPLKLNSNEDGYSKEAGSEQIANTDTSNSINKAARLTSLVMSGWVHQIQSLILPTNNISNKPHSRPSSPSNNNPRQQATTPLPSRPPQSTKSVL